jgi:hypothetical protein
LIVGVLTLGVCDAAKMTGQQRNGGPLLIARRISPFVFKLPVPGAYSGSPDGAIIESAGPA